MLRGVFKSIPKGATGVIKRCENGYNYGIKFDKAEYIKNQFSTMIWRGDSDDCGSGKCGECFWCSIELAYNWIEL